MQKQTGSTKPENDVKQNPQKGTDQTRRSKSFAERRKAREAKRLVRY